MTVIRSTLWFEFARQNLERMKRGFLSIVPEMTVRPVALDSVARLVADCVVGDRVADRYEVCGPQSMTLWQMTMALPHKGCLPVPIRVPGAFGRALRDGTLVPGDACEVVGPEFAGWLQDQAVPDIEPTL